MNEETKRRGRPPKIVQPKPEQEIEEPYDRLEVESQPMSLDTTRVKVWASLGMTLNIGNYENQKIDIGVTGLPVDAPPEYIQEQLQKATVTLHSAVEHLAKEMARRLQEDYGR